MAAENTSWQLEDFVDSLVVELDKTRETLAVKAINKPLSYTVKEMALDLNIFPSYDGDQVRFITAQPGQQGASKVTIQLGSITDQQVRATTKVPGQKNEIKLSEMDVDPKTRKQLRKLGVNSAEDLKQLERKNVDLGKVSEDAIDYRKLASQIEKSRRRQTPPKVNAALLSMDEEARPQLVIQGENLAIDPRFQPVAVVNDKLAEVLSYDEHELRIQITADHNLAADNEVVLTVDPFAVLKMNVKTGAETL
jgi:hypothetical protein